jgi:hypothetical protein
MTTVADKILGENEDESEGHTQAFKTELNRGSIGKM